MNSVNNQNGQFNLPQALQLYAVTDRAWLSGRSLESVVEEAIVGGASMIQIREKHCPNALFLERTCTLKRITDRYGIPLIVNDSLETALASNASGLHIGQDDIPTNEARQRLGPEKILGVSVQTKEQAIAAEQAGADYLGAGAVFPTATKDDASAVSFRALTEICTAVHIPVVAIGGITAENVQRLTGSGISGIAVVSAIFASPNIKDATKQLFSVVTDSIRFQSVNFSETTGEI